MLARQNMIHLACHWCRGAPWRVARKAFESAVMHRSALDLHMEVMQEVSGWVGGTGREGRSG
jgi:hypothetical protein